MDRTAALGDRPHRRKAAAPPNQLRCALSLAATLTLATAATAAAAPPPAPGKVAEETPHPGDPAAGYRWARGWVVRINGPELVIDLGTADGLRRGQELALYRTVKARHPRTGKELVDRFVAGLSPVVDVATHLSLLKPDKELLAQLAEGDLVECQVPAPAAPVAVAPMPTKRKTPAEKEAAGVDSGKEASGPPSACPPATACPPCPPSVAGNRAGATPDEIAIDESFRNSLGRTPAERIAIWQDWLRRFPGSAHAGAVQREIDAMHEQSANMRAARADAERLTQLTSAQRRIFHDQLDKLRVQEAGWLVFSAADWGHIADLRVHLRAKGKQTYQLARPEPSGPLHRRLRVPQALVAEPGFEYFVELTLVDTGETKALVATPRAPVWVFVEDPFAEVGRRPVDASTFRMVGELVDFNRGRGDDQFIYAEVSLGYRLQDPKLLYAFEMGYGLLSGEGGAVAAGPVFDMATQKPVVHQSGPKAGLPIAKDDTLDPRRRAFKYGYLQTEWALHASFHALTRLVVGLARTASIPAWS